MFLLEIPAWVPQWLYYPGLEVWKFANLAIFIAVGIYILRNPLQSALAARRETIKRQIAEAQAERDLAAQSLAEAQSLLGQMSDDVEQVRINARKEAEQERERLATAADQGIEKLKAQGAREIQGSRKLAQRDLQRFLAGRSLELARSSVISQLRPEDDNRFIKDRLDEFGRARS